MPHRHIALIYGLILGASPAWSADKTVITHLKTRDHQITVKANEGETRYTISDKEGKILAENLSTTELQHSQPELYDQIRSALAKKLNASAK